ncbi:hypothetical protein GCM10009525_81540 [Streptosporangium amethystogenes subsp. fukuiense]
MAGLLVTCESYVARESPSAAGVPPHSVDGNRKPRSRQVIFGSPRLRRFMARSKQTRLGNEDLATA